VYICKVALHYTTIEVLTVAIDYTVNCLVVSLLVVLWALGHQHPYKIVGWDILRVPKSWGSCPTEPMRWLCPWTQQQFDYVDWMSPKPHVWQATYADVSAVGLKGCLANRTD
jgi:hypothetical protein